MRTRFGCCALVLAVLLLAIAGSRVDAQPPPGGELPPVFEGPSKDDSMEKKLAELQQQILPWYPLITTGLGAGIVLLLVLILFNMQQRQRKA